MAINLDKLERRVFDYIQGCDFEESLLAAIKELKAAREALEFARTWISAERDYQDTAQDWDRVNSALESLEARRG